MSAGPSDSSLAQHLARVEAYVRRTRLVDPALERPELRAALATFMMERGPQILDAWVRDIGTAFDIPETDWGRIKADQQAALTRWARQVLDRSDHETFHYLRRHTRRGFIAQFPASRFLAAQMRLVQYLETALRDSLADDPRRRDAMLALLAQEFRQRILHITDFFVEGREELLLQQEDSYRRAIEHAPAAILMADVMERRVFQANRVAERLLGFDQATLIGTPLLDLVPTSERDRYESLIETALRKGHATRDGLHLSTRDGRQIPTLTTAGFIEYGDRRWLQLVCVDVSDRERLEAQLIQSEKLAAIGQLAAGIAHELRNPLAIVMNALYDLRQLLANPSSAVVEDLVIAEEEIGRAQAIIKNLLEFSRESGAEVERVDLNDVVTRALQLMQKALQNAGVRVTADLGPVPRVLANANAVRQIVLNLVTNAVQAMPGGGELTLRTARASGNRVRLEVRDTGIGIPSASLSEIFNPFFTTKAPGQGTGLGLSVVHSILRRYHGDILVESTVGEGSVFTVELPCPCHDEGLPLTQEP